MGMDVIGNNPTSKTGDYFRANIWYWHPLWEYCECMHPTIVAKVKHGHSNDGDGLNGAYARALSQAIKRDLKDGKANQYYDELQRELESLSDIKCVYCDETGKRIFSISEEEKDQPCNVCKGTLLMSHPAKDYVFSLQLLEEFSDFLQDCGGFKIC
jgi:hypothetical protein